MGTDKEIDTNDHGIIEKGMISSGAGSCPAFLLLLIDLAAVANLKNQDHNLAILNICQKPVVAYAVAPLATPVCCQPFSVLSGILAAFQILTDPSDNHGRGMFIKLFEFLQCIWGEFNMICHNSPSSFSTSESVWVTGFSRYAAYAFSYA